MFFIKIKKELIPVEYLGALPRGLFIVGAYTGWQSIPDQQVTPMMNAREFATFMKESIEDQNRVKGQNEPIPEVYQDPSKYGEGTDWYDVLTRRSEERRVGKAYTLIAGR